tara:strand:- start:630 stop:836 length:207 start_codon:yes stop_codon:yes gene_type:complete
MIWIALAIILVGAFGLVLWGHRAGQNKEALHVARETLEREEEADAIRRDTDALDGDTVDNRLRGKWSR